MVKVTSAAPGADSSAGVSRSKVFPDPCGPYTPQVRSNGTHSSPQRGTLPTPRRQPTLCGVNRCRRGACGVVAGACSTAPGSTDARPRRPRRPGWPACGGARRLARRPARPYRSGRISLRIRRSRPIPNANPASVRVAIPIRRLGPYVVHTHTTAATVATSRVSSTAAARPYTNAGAKPSASALRPAPTCPVISPTSAGISVADSGHSHPRPVTRPARPCPASNAQAAAHSQARSDSERYFPAPRHRVGAAPANAVRGHTPVSTNPPSRSTPPRAPSSSERAAVGLASRRGGC